MVSIWQVEAWKDRLIAAMKDGIEQDGLSAVQDVLRAASQDLKLGLNIPRSRGTPGYKEAPAGVMKAARYFLECKHRPTHEELAEVAGMDWKSFAKTWHPSKRRFLELVGAIAAERIAEKKAAAVRAAISKMEKFTAEHPDILQRFGLPLDDKGHEMPGSALQSVMTALLDARQASEPDEAYRRARELLGLPKVT